MFVKLGDVLVNMDRVCYAEYMPVEEGDDSDMEATLNIKFSDMEVDEIVTLEFVGEEATTHYQTLQKKLGTA